MLTQIKHNDKIIVTLFFLVYLGIGLSIVGDYGLAYDEPLVRKIGHLNVSYILQENTDLLTYNDKYPAPFFHILLASLERILRLTDSRHIYLMRYLVTFLLFYASVFVFYLLCKDRFGDWKIGLLGSFFLILTPRIFAHSFYNSKDLPSVSFFIISIYILIRYLDRKTWPRLFCHALTCAILIDIRTVGILVCGLTFLFVLGEQLFRSRSISTLKKTILDLVQYSLFVIVFVRLFFPMLWQDPLYHFTQVFLEARQYSWSQGMLYLGQYIYIHEIGVPWHYLPVWIAVTTPLLYLLLFVIGLPVMITSLVKTRFTEYFARPTRNDLIFLCWFFLPICAVIFLGSTVYDGWRHLFFTFPACLLIGLHGLIFLVAQIKTISKKQLANIAYAVLAGLVIIGVADPLYFMVKYHPYQYVYFNRLAGKDMHAVKQTFELDYWGASYTHALSYIAQNDPDPEVVVWVESFPWAPCDAMLPSAERNKIICTNKFDKAKYFLGNYRMNRNGYPCGPELYSISVRGVNIVVVHDATQCERGS